MTNLQNLRDEAERGFDKEYAGLCLGSTQEVSYANKIDLKSFLLAQIDKAFEAGRKSAFDEVAVLVPVDNIKN